MAVVAMEATRASTVSQAAGGSEVNKESVFRGLTSSQKETILGSLALLRRSADDRVDLKISDAAARLLGHQDPQVAAAAAAAIGSMGAAAGKYVDQLLSALRHASAPCRASAAEAFGRLGPPIRKDVNRAVAACLNDQEGTVRAAALWALGVMRATEQAEAIGTGLRDASPDVRSAAIEALGALVSASREVESLFSPEALQPHLFSMLENPQTRCSALSCIAVLGEKAPTVCALGVVDAVADEDPITRQAAVTAVGSTAKAVADSPDAMEKLKVLLKNDRIGVRAAAATALAAVGAASARYADAVVELLTDDSVDESSVALQMGSSARRAPAQLRIPKCAALTALGRMDNAACASRIADFLFDVNWEVRVTAAEALATLGNQARGEVSALIGALDDDAHPVRAKVCHALGEIKDPEAIPRLVEAFEDRAPSVRVAAVNAVAEMGENAEDACHDVFKLLNDNSPTVRATAIRCLPLLGETAHHYAGVIGSMLLDDEDEVRCAVAQALSRMGLPGASFSDEVAELLDDPADEVRQAAAEALERMGKRSSQLPMIKDFGRHPGVPAEQGSFEGLGSHYGNIQQKKAELQLSGKWIDGVL